jgi:hypothetical protein
MIRNKKKRLSTIGLAAVFTISAPLLASCAGTSSSSKDTQITETELTDSEIAEILPEFDFEDLELESTQKNFYTERTDETLPVIINYQGRMTSKTPRQCLGGSNPISRSFEATLLSDGWTIDSLLTGDHSTALESSNLIRSVEVFRKSDFVLSVECVIQIGSDVETQQVEGSWGSVGTRRSCIINNGPDLGIILSFKSVPKIIMEMAGETMKWEKTSLNDVDPFFLDDAWRLSGTREFGYSEPILDYEGIPYSYRNEYPMTPNDTNHGPIRACRLNQQSEWAIPD